MTSAEKEVGPSRSAANLRTNSVDFADKEGGGPGGEGGQKIPKFFGRHIYRSTLAAIKGLDNSHESRVS